MSGKVGFPGGLVGSSSWSRCPRRHRMTKMALCKSMLAELGYAPDDPACFRKGGLYVTKGGLVMEGCCPLGFLPQLGGWGGGRKALGRRELRFCSWEPSSWFLCSSHWMPAVRTVGFYGCFLVLSLEVVLWDIMFLEPHLSWGQACEISQSLCGHSGMWWAP